MVADYRKWIAATISIKQKILSDLQNSTKEWL